jgi:alkaline phosphatase D
MTLVRFGFYSLIISVFLAITHAPQQAGADKPQTATLAFGSCLRQWQPQPVWRGIASLKPEAFIFLGDNVYTDVGDYRQQQAPERIRQAYRDLRSSAEYQRFLTSAQENDTAIYAVWDDHDYGKNNAGADYKFKIASKQYFLDFFDISNTVPGRGEPGIYRTEYLDLNGVRVQLLLLDTRSFRSPLKYDSATPACPRANIGTNTDIDATMLGDKQWQWLKTELLKPADIRMLASSIQVLPTEHCYEKWANFPRERDKLFKMLKRTRANGVIVLSGDRHLAEISRLPPHVIGYALYETTSSGLNSAMGEQSQGKTERNSLRATSDNVLVNNFGSIEITKRDADIELKLQIRDEMGGLLQHKVVSLDSLTHENPR